MTEPGSPAVTQAQRQRAIPIALVSIIDALVRDALEARPKAQWEEYLRTVRTRASAQAATQWDEERRYVVDEVEEIFEDVVFDIAARLRNQPFTA